MANSLAGQDAGEEGKAAPSVHAILREASELVLKQGNHESFWTERVLQVIGEEQTRAGDFDGALRSLRGSSDDIGRNGGLVRLVEAMARAGKKDRALEVGRMLDPKSRWTPQHVQDVVQFQWACHLIDKRDLQEGRKAIESIKSPENRHTALRNLAVAHAKAGDPAQAAKCFAEAIDRAKGIKAEYEQAEALLETAESQRKIGSSDAARATLRQLAEKADRFKNALARTFALRQCAALTEKLNDKEAARALFDRALKSQQTVNDLNKLGALEQIAIAQADVGFIEDAQTTAAMIEKSADGIFDSAYAERVRYSIAIAQLKTGDAAGAMDTALSVKHFLQYRDDALDSIVAYHSGRRDPKAALAATEKFDNPSRKAAAILKAAAAQARAGDRKKAADMTSKIKLTQRSELNQLLVQKDQGFEFGRPEKWGKNYDSGDIGTMLSYRVSVRNTAKVAAAAMELAQALEYKPPKSYAVLFNDINSEEIVQSLARSHAVFGDPKEALAWAKQIGSDAKIPEKDRDRISWAVQRRIHAMIGVAEGLLERSKH
jgi:tetratricopeptide (TPR) repeat protein